MQRLTKEQIEIIKFRCTCIDSILNNRITRGMKNVPKHFDFYKEISGKYFGKQLYDVVETTLEEMSIILGNHFRSSVSSDIDKEIVDVYKKQVRG